MGGRGRGGGRGGATTVFIWQKSRRENNWSICPSSCPSSSCHSSSCHLCPYAVLNNLGSGAFGVVKKALYEPPDRAVPEHQVALKLLHEGPTEAEELEFAREVWLSSFFCFVFWDHFIYTSRLIDFVPPRTRRGPCCSWGSPSLHADYCLHPMVCPIFDF